MYDQNLFLNMLMIVKLYLTYAITADQIKIQNDRLTKWQKKHPMRYFCYIFLTVHSIYHAMFNVS